MKLEEVIRMAGALLNRILRRTHQCERCQSWKTEHGWHWARGRNNLCEQAYSDAGAYCTECHHITWDVSLEEHKARIPSWCTPYGNQ